MSTARWGILCTAEIAHKVVTAIHSSSNGEVVAVASRSLERAEAWAKEHKIPTAYGSYDELIAADNVDILYIPLPSAYKKEWVIKAAQAGKHVLVEKPFSGPVSDVEEMITACEQNGVQFLDGSMWKHGNRAQAIREHISEGKIGTIKRIHSSFTFAAPNEEWIQGGNGRTDKTREPFGCFGDMGWYPVTAALWALGSELPTKVQMLYSVENKVDTIISAGGLLYFSDDRHAMFTCGCQEAHRCFLELSGSNGRILVDDLVGGQGRTGDFGAYFGPFVGSDKFVLGDVMGLDTEVSVTPCDHTVKMVEKLSSIALGGTAAVESEWPRQSLVSHRVMHALFQSSQQNGAVITL
jgi:predicted dehydrogenase